MISKAAEAEGYLKDMPAEKKEAFNKLRETILENIPEGYKEVAGKGMIHYVVPHSLFPAGYHCNPSLPLSLAGIAVQKNFISLHHMGMYGSPSLLNWFTTEYPRHCKSKLDMGKSCVRFKKMDDIPYKLIGELMKKISVKEYLDAYQKIMNRK